jgi:uroporphyrinogen-III synthase
MNRPRVLVVRSGARPFGPVSGADVLEHVSHSIEPLAGDPGEWSGGWDTIIFTSQTAVERVARDAVHADALRGALESARLLAVGRATAETLRRHGLQPGNVAGGSARSMLEKLATSHTGRRVLWPCGEDASVELDAMLRERGATVRRMVLYRKRAAAPNPGLSPEILEQKPAAFCATSPAAAHWLFAGLTEEAAEKLRETPAVALGPSTLEKLASFGVERVVVAGQALFTSAADALARLARAPDGT